MFQKILIANRGEIACRVIRTARRLGIATVAIYSDADADALHVALADEAYRVGPAAVAQSYLDADRILKIAARSGAEAIHPGYGFLSENAAFAEAVAAAGLRFIGPTAASIRAMGLKDAAKALMQNAGVPVVPGYHGANQNPDFLAGEADHIGYPVLIKARAGGGGKGMRRVDDPAAFKAALEGAQREGKASFGDATVLIEKYVAKPRHIEIQVFGDDHGNVVHLFERDCSLQRRHQKVVEEAPAPGMSPEMRAAMGAAAVTAAKAIDYSGAGTIEFIVDVSEGLRPDRFYFMEMNTRLQVEHPVTEMITGHDLVEWQLRVASGEPLPVAQSDLAIDGWAFEARLYAENAERDFLPATGTLEGLAFPPEQPSVRVDTGVRQGDTITPHYDPMIAKIIVHGGDRETALARLRHALAQTSVTGTITNATFLGALANHADFASGDVDTGLIGRDQEALTRRPDTPDAAIALAALAALGWPGGGASAVRDPAAASSSGQTTGQTTGPGDIWQRLGPWRLWDAAAGYTRLLHGDRVIDVRATAQPGAMPSFELSWDHTACPIAFAHHGSTLVARSGDHTFHARVIAHGATLTVLLDGTPHSFEIADLLAAGADEAADSDRVTAPMPGLIKIVTVATGDSVRKGDPVIVMEAMKMEHTLSAPRDGTVGELTVSAGDQVEEAAVLLTMAEA